MSERVGVSTTAAYAAPLVPIWMLHTPALSILPGLYATVSGIDLATIGAILVFSRVLDGITLAAEDYGAGRVDAMLDRAARAVLFGPED